MTTVTAGRRRPATAGRRAGYVVAVLVNAALLYAVNVWPGWREVPFLTAETPLVLGAVNAAVVVSLVANVVYVVHDPRWLRGLGDLLTLGVGVMAMLRVWRVFPFRFGGGAVDWELIVRIALVVGIVGSMVAMVVAFVSFVRGLFVRR